MKFHKQNKKGTEQVKKKEKERERDRQIDLIGRQIERRKT